MPFPISARLAGRPTRTIWAVGSKELQSAIDLLCPLETECFSRYMSAYARSCQSSAISEDHRRGGDGMPANAGKSERQNASLLRGCFQHGVAAVGFGNTFCPGLVR